MDKVKLLVEAAQQLEAARKRAHIADAAVNTCRTNLRQAEREQEKADFACREAGRRLLEVAGREG